MRVAVVGLDDRLDDRKTKTRTVAAASSTWLSAPEAIKDTVVRVNRQAWSVIADFDDSSVALNFCADLYRSSDRGVNHRVAGQVGQNLAQLFRIAKNSRLAIRYQLDIALRGHRTCISHGMIGKLTKIHGHESHLGKFVESCEQQQVLNQGPHPGGFGLNAGHGPLQLLGFACRAQPEQLCVATDGCERGAQFVGGVGQEAAQAVLALAAIRERLLDLYEHLVQRRPEPSDFSSLIVGRDPACEVSVRDVAGDASHTLKRPQANPDHDPSQRRQGKNYRRSDKHLDENQPFERLFDIPQRDRNDQHTTT